MNHFHSKNKPRPLTQWQVLLLVGGIIALTSQFYLLVLADNTIRISAAVILYPILLLALVEDWATLWAGGVTTGLVLLLRIALQLSQGIGLQTALRAVLAGSCYYLIYALLFYGFRRMEFHSRLRHIVPALLLCDLLANFGELVLSNLLGQGAKPTVTLVYSLMGVALLRTAITAVLLWWLGYYRRLLMEEEHEARYQRLFLMSAQLKNEAYLLEKSTNQIESVMSSAYRLYEELSKENHPATDLALSITRDIHEVKKDGQRVLRGLEAGLEHIFDGGAISYSDLLRILLDTSKSITLGGKIQITQSTQQDFSTSQHHQLASILRNLINNAIEAITADSGTGRVHIAQCVSGGDMVFTVSDDGPGITQRGLQNLFQMGYSTKFNPVTGDMNRGVGLSTVKSLVEGLGGEISATSELGVGTVFHITIPQQSLISSELHESQETQEDS